MLQKRPRNSFEWIKDTSQLNEYFIKNYNVGSNEKCVFFFEVDVQRFEKSHTLHNDLPFLL